MTHICVSKLTIIGSDNGLAPERRQANIWNNAGVLLNGTSGTNFREILSEIHTCSLKDMQLKTSSGKRRPFCHCLNVLKKTTYSIRWTMPICRRKVNNELLWAELMIPWLTLLHDHPRYFRNLLNGRPAYLCKITFCTNGLISFPRTVTPNNAKDPEVGYFHVHSSAVTFL